MPIRRITATLTSFNRKASTLECLARLQDAAANAGVSVRAVLVDDGSTDGTGEAVAQHYPWVQVLGGDGSLFWNRGMHKAIAHALADGEPTDAILWLNDDTSLLPDALQNLCATADALETKHGRPAIVVGATRDRASGRMTYSGQVALSRFRRFNFRRVFDAAAATPCETMNGNVVLVPIAVARDVGNLDPVFEHSMGDIDYGLRARSRKHPLYVAPGFVGECSLNPVVGSYQDTSLPLRVRWRKFSGRKVLPPKSWLQLTRRHGGLLWPLHFAWPYVSFLAGGLAERRSARHSSPKSS